MRLERTLIAVAAVAGIAVGMGQPAFGQTTPPNVRVVLALTPPPALQDGLSWATPFQNPQDALAAAAVLGSGIDEIWVAKGVYLPTTTTDRTISFVLLPDVKMYGGFSGTELLLSQRAGLYAFTVLSGDIDGNPADHAADSHHVVRVSQSGIHWFDGFTIQFGGAIPDVGGTLTSPTDFGGGFLAFDPAGVAGSGWEVESATRRSATASQRSEEASAPRVSIA